MDYCCISSRRDTRDTGEKEMNEERKKEKIIALLYITVFISSSIMSLPCRG